MSVNNTPRTWVVGETATAANMNAEIRDPLTGIQAAWDTYTPALTATTTNSTLGTGSSAAGTFIRYGKSIRGTAEIVFGSSGVAAGSGSYGVSLPAAATAAGVSAGRVVGYGVFFDSSTGNFYHVIVTLSASATVARMVLDGAGVITNAAPVVSAANDQIRIHFDYEAA